jgi:hypothetical protein
MASEWSWLMDLLIGSVVLGAVRLVPRGLGTTVGRAFRCPNLGMLPSLSPTFHSSIWVLPSGATRLFGAVFRLIGRESNESSVHGKRPQFDVEAWTLLVRKCGADSRPALLCFAIGLILSDGEHIEVGQSRRRGWRQRRG